MSSILLVIILLALLAALPRWEYSRDWGYGPSGVLAVVLVLLVIMALTHSGAPLR
ncbi:conserved exported hypothetical protein [Hyphomicrobium sp. GJ21]|jgi:succinate dehydrogenase hydrophobic anchor subunit|uniref:DUF3309 family protein n=1 Tax=Hyphomicrobium sp. GJ21 TaxID=113574 RepID=UPI000622B782|nr:DUF3309 family protein [Hyphomicrobium sp. GJ21]CEJ86241.1 conserved exported hypothetical protein [Hyphomicrobium sp. GJ21]